MKIKVAIADDQRLFLSSLASLVNTFPQFEVIIEACNGEDLLAMLRKSNVLPDILLIDVNMPVMDGPETVKEISAQWPGIRTVALSMKDDDLSVISMLKAGACAYLLKDIDPLSLQRSLTEIISEGYAHSDLISLNYRKLIVRSSMLQDVELSTREKDFLQLACSDLPYKAIAAKMFLSEKTIDGYRDSIFQKLNVKSRVGMVLEAMRRKLINMEQIN